MQVKALFFPKRLDIQPVNRMLTPYNSTILKRRLLMNERTGIITFKGNPMTLLGSELKVGDKAPDFAAVDTTLAPVGINSHVGKIRIISAVPSLDTPVCDTETRRFNQEAAALPENVVVLTVSMDLPFAQKRWCGAAGIDRVTTLSDYRDRSFGYAYGVVIKELLLLARCIFVVDGQGIIRYIQQVPEVTSEPDYAAVIAATKALL
jgi:thiol peroxidase